MLCIDGTPHNKGLLMMRSRIDLKRDRLRHVPLFVVSMALSEVMLLVHVKSGGTHSKDLKIRAKEKLANPL